MARVLKELKKAYTFWKTLEDSEEIDFVEFKGNNGKIEIDTESEW
mgnify:CR=1 FL=1